MELSEWYPILLLLLLLAVVYFVSTLHSLLYDEGTSANFTKKKEGMTNWATVPTVSLDIYATQADGRPIIGIMNNLYFDYKGMNIVDVDFNAYSNYNEITLINRSGKEFHFKTYYKDIPAIDSTFFKVDTLANLSGTYTPFMYNTDWQTSATNVTLLVVPYKDENMVDNTFLVIWDNSNVSNGLNLLSVHLLTLASTQAKSAHSITATDFPTQSLITNTASSSGESTSPTVGSSGGLPYIYSSSSINVSMVLTADNAKNVLQSRTISNPHYYYVANNVNVYPKLTSITPFVYFNPLNGDLVVLNGSFYTRDGGGSNSGQYLPTTTWTTDQELQLETSTDFAGMIKTSSIRRYRRPLQTASLLLSDYKNDNTLSFDMMEATKNDDARLYNDTDKAFTIRTDLASVPSLSMFIANLPPSLWLSLDQETE